MSFNFFKKHPKYTICIIATIVAAAMFYYFIGDYGKSFRDNIVPEIVGIAIELIILIFILGFFAAKKETDRLRQLEKRARDYLRFIIVNLLKNDSLFQEIKLTLPSIVDYESNKNNFKFLAKDKPRNDEVIDAIIVALTKVSEDKINKSIKININRDLPTFLSLTPVLAEISGEHFKAWSRIIHFLTKASENENVTPDLIKILQKIKHFDYLTNEQFKSIL